MYHCDVNTGNILLRGGDQSMKEAKNMVNLKKQNPVPTCFCLFQHLRSSGKLHFLEQECSQILDLRYGGLFTMGGKNCAHSFFLFSHSCRV